jgi:hypothetical protein
MQTSNPNYPTATCPYWHGSDSRRPWIVARDGRFLIDIVFEQASAEPIHLLLNWKPPTK